MKTVLPASKGHTADYWQTAGPLSAFQPSPSAPHFDRLRLLTQFNFLTTQFRNKTVRNDEEKFLHRNLPQATSQFASPIYLATKCERQWHGVK